MSLPVVPTHQRPEGCAPLWRDVALVMSALLTAASGADKQVPAFPGAEGYGAVTRGGRGGRVIEVTSLADKGPGTFRAALEAEGPRTVVFRVAGLITLETPVKIAHPFITIAGQTAPGDGICVRGHTTEINTHEVIIRHLRFRRGNLRSRDDALGGYPVRNIILDHCSFSWGLDENISLYRWIEELPDGKILKHPAENVTIQWCISSEALNLNNHAFGGTWGGRNVSFHHNLFACNTGRNPSIGYGDHVDFRNNVIFNWVHRTVDGGDASSWVNVVANYYLPGPATLGYEVHRRIARPQHLKMFSEAPTPGKWFVADNVVAGHPEVSRDNWAGGVQFDEPDIQEAGGLRELVARVRGTEPFAAARITQHSAVRAHELVLAQAGATLPRRDPVDIRILDQMRTGKMLFSNGIILTPADVGGWPEYTFATVPADRDHDGMPDEWEKQHGLNPDDPGDSAKDADGDGYTNLEEFLNGTDPRRAERLSAP
jgi:pectate lyase